MIRVGLDWRLYAEFSAERPGNVIIQNNSGANLYIFFGDVKPNNKDDDPSLILPSSVTEKEYLFITKPVWLSSDAEVVIRFTPMTIFPRLIDRILVNRFLTSEIVKR